MYYAKQMHFRGWVSVVMRALVCAVFMIPFSAATVFAASPHVKSDADTSRCAVCHSTHEATAPMLIRQASTSGAATSVCYGCHDGTDSEGADIAAGSVDSFALASGHSMTAASAGTAKVDGCASCHYTHGAVDQADRMLPAKTVNGVAVTSAGQQLCLACHSSADSWFGPGYPSTSAPTRDATGYPVSGTWPGSAAYAAPSNAHRLLPETTVTVGGGSPQPREQGDCRYCHASHRGANDYDSLLSTFTVPTSDTLSADKTDGSYADLCFTCHGGVKPSGLATTPVDIQSFATSSSVSAGHSIVTSGGLLPVGSPLPCFECHNPHGSNRGNGALLSDERGASLETTTATGVRRFCFTCHTTPAGTEGWSGTAYVAVSPTDKVVGIPREGGVLHLSARTGHAVLDTASCYDCHGNSYAANGNNVHNPSIGTTVIPLALGSQPTSSRVGSDTVAPTTVADMTAAPSGIVSLVATDTGSGVDVTYFTLDGGGLNVGTRVLAATEGTHTVQYWSVDASQNVEPPNTTVFSVDLTAPATSSDATSSYVGTATITLTALDEEGGSGVASTWYRVDAGAEATGSIVTTDTAGDHTLRYWSIDSAGNVESSQTATFTIVPAGEHSVADPAVAPVVLANAAAGLGGVAYSGVAGMRPPTGFALAGSSLFRVTAG